MPQSSKPQSSKAPSGKAPSGKATDSQKPKRRGRRIPQTVWPGILQKYQLGSTLTAIAEEFDCTPSAISYIVKRAEEIYGDLTGADHLPRPVRRTTGSVQQPSQLRPKEECQPASSQDTSQDNCQDTGRAEPLDEMEARLASNAEMLLACYRQWQQGNAETDENSGARDEAMKLAEQLHDMRRSLAKLEIMLSRDGLKGSTTTAPQRPPRSRYAQGWTPA